MENLSFEQAFEQLKDAVQRLEAGDLPLVESLTLFEQGAKLARHCDQQLHRAELRVREIVSDGDGGFETAPFDGWDAS